MPVPKRLTSVFLALALPALTHSAATAQTLTTLHTFADVGTDFPSNLVAGQDGLLFGLDGQHSIFSLTPPALPGGPWTYSQIANPTKACLIGIVVGLKGDIFGVNCNGGAANLGSIFALLKPATAGDPWKPALIYSFTAAGGNKPQSPISVGPDGTLYGRTSAGGPSGLGTVYSVSPPAIAGAAWTGQDIYGSNLEDSYLDPGVISIGADGTLYLPEVYEVYSLSPPAVPGAIWTKSTLYQPDLQSLAATRFTVAVPIPQGGLFVIAETSPVSFGDVFALTPPVSGGLWNPAVLHQFGATPTDGQGPVALIRGSGGVLYGATYGGGIGYGTVFSLTPPSSPGGPYKYKVLWAFTGGSDGCSPNSLILGEGGLLYGTTAGCSFEAPIEGTAFSLTTASVEPQTVGAIVHHFPIGGSPYGIAAGPDGALWVTDSLLEAVDRITTAGVITGFPLSAGTAPKGITAGPDGALWFAESGANKIGRMTTDGNLAEFLVPASQNVNVSEIVAGSDGALWFTEDYYGYIGRITTDGIITQYGGWHKGSSPLGIAAGSDGALWFTLSSLDSHGTGYIGRVTTDGKVTEFSAGLNIDPQYITAGPDGALWFTLGHIASYVPEIGRITTSGAVTLFNSPLEGGQITTGPDGALWYGTTGNVGPDAVGHLTTSGAPAAYHLPDNPGVGNGITTGPDGAIWFADSNGVVQIVSETAALTATPEMSLPGNPIVLAGGGFSAGESVQLFLDSTSGNLLATAVAGADGTFTQSIASPASNAGDNSIVGVGQSSGRSAVASIYTNPVLTATPATGTPGTLISVSGAGFADHQAVQIQWRGTRTYVATAIADASGTFTGAVFAIPAGTPPGPQTIGAEAFADIELFAVTTILVQ